MVLYAPTLVLLSVGSFNGLYKAFTQTLEDESDLLYLAGDTLCDLLSIGTLAMISEFNRHYGLRFISWLCIVPALVIAVACVVFSIYVESGEEELPKKAGPFGLRNRERRKLLRHMS